MAQRTSLADADCSIAQALDVVGDWWTLLIVRDTARGVHRFDALQQELGVSRKVLTERLRLLVEAGVLAREPYQERPVRYEYRLTPRGRALLPVLIALQDWGDAWVLGEGETMATAAEASREADRVAGLLGTRVPELALTGADGERHDPVADTPYTVLYCFPSAYARADAYPPGWAGIPGRAAAPSNRARTATSWPSSRPPEPPCTGSPCSARTSSAPSRRRRGCASRCSRTRT